MAFNIDPATLELEEQVIETRRVSKTVKGGRIMRFASVVVVGDRNGHIGYGIGKSAEVPEAIRKALEDAKKSMITVSLKNTSIPHDIIGEFGAARVLLKPASEGTGIIAGGTVRSVVEMAGIKDIRAKSLRSNNKINVVKATFEGLKNLRTAEDVAKTRGKTTEEIVSR